MGEMGDEEGGGGEGARRKEGRGGREGEMSGRLREWKEAK